MADKELWLPYKIKEILNVFNAGEWHCHIVVDDESVDYIKDGYCYEAGELPESMLIDGQPAHTFYGLGYNPEEVQGDGYGE